MASNITLKVYNKEDKLKLLVHETDALKVFNVYKYYEENEETHSFTYFKVPAEDSRRARISYYDYFRTNCGKMVERMWVTDQQIEHIEIIGNTEAKTTTILKSGNEYEERKVKSGDEVCSVEFKNGSLVDFGFTISEIKINEYLEKVSYGRAQKN